MKWFAVICLCLSCSVFAHSLSTAFMQLQNTEAGLSATLELSIVDLQQALNWPADQDIRWSDIKKIRHKSSAICSNICIYKQATRQLCIGDRCASMDCSGKSQTYYLSLPLFSTCDTQQSSLHYQLFSELHDHKLLVNWQDKQWVISQQSPALNLTQMAP